MCTANDIAAPEIGCYFRQKCTGCWPCGAVLWSSQRPWRRRCAREPQVSPFPRTPSSSSFHPHRPPQWWSSPLEDQTQTTTQTCRAPKGHQQGLHDEKFLQQSFLFKWIRFWAVIVDVSTLLGRHTTFSFIPVWWLTKDILGQWRGQSRHMWVSHLSKQNS